MTSHREGNSSFSLHREGLRAASSVSSDLFRINQQAEATYETSEDETRTLYDGLAAVTSGARGGRRVRKLRPVELHRDGQTRTEEGTRPGLNPQRRIDRQLRLHLRRERRVGAR
jgi:hypothetical protein